MLLRTDYLRRANNRSSGRTIVVTGGAGFIGSNLCAALLASGHRVTCLDNLLTGSKTNLVPLMKAENFRFVQHDICAPLPLQGPIDEIYNLACPASPPKYQADPLHTFRTSTEGMINVLELAQQTGARVLQASTSEVYGDPEISPQSETYRGAVNTFGPRACYDEGKRASETLCHDYAARRGVAVRVVRIFNTYGPNMDPEDGRVVSNFIVQALKGLPLTIFGSGLQTRSFCHVDDMVAGLRAVMDLPDAVVAPVNIGNPGEFTVRELAEKVIGRTGARSEFVDRPLPVDDPRQRRPDITRMTALTGWRPIVSLDEGLARTIPYFADRLAVTGDVESTG